jgi:hypothetical protein
MSFKSIRALWVFLTVAVLTVVLRGFDGRPNSDIEEVLAWTMLPLGFPASLLFPAAFAGYASAREALGQGPVVVTYLSLVVSWAVLFALGFIQWFILLPALLRRLRARRARTAGG